MEWNLSEVRMWPCIAPATARIGIWTKRFGPPRILAKSLLRLPLGWVKVCEKLINHRPLTNYASYFSILFVGRWILLYRSVIKGWDESVIGRWNQSTDGASPYFSCFASAKKIVVSWILLPVDMSLGEVARIHCTPDYAYGSGGFPVSHITLHHFAKQRSLLLIWPGHVDFFSVSRF